MHKKQNREAEGNNIDLMDLFMLVLTELAEIQNNPNYYFGS